MIVPFDGAATGEGAGAASGSDELEGGSFGNAGGIDNGFPGDLPGDSPTGTGRMDGDIPGASEFCDVLLEAGVLDAGAVGIKGASGALI